jgi:hypothetical protein
MKYIESFFRGIIAALGALVLEIAFFAGFQIFGNPVSALSFSQFFIIPQFIIIAALIEEIFKYIVISKRIDMSSIENSILINSFLVGLGFFGVELALISALGTLPAWPSLAGIATLHIGTAGLIGYIITVKNPNKITTSLYAVSIAALFHIPYNLLSIKMGSLSENYPILIVLGLLVFLNIANFFRINRSVG